MLCEKEMSHFMTLYITYFFQVYFETSRIFKSHIKQKEFNR